MDLELGGASRWVADVGTCDDDSDDVVAAALRRLHDFESSVTLENSAVKQQIQAEPLRNSYDLEFNDDEADVYVMPRAHRTFSGVPAYDESSLPQSDALNITYTSLDPAQAANASVLRQPYQSSAPTVSGLFASLRKQLPVDQPTPGLELFGEVHEFLYAEQEACRNANASSSSRVCIDQEVRPVTSADSDTLEDDFTANFRSSLRQRAARVQDGPARSLTRTNQDAERARPMQPTANPMRSARSKNANVDFSIHVPASMPSHHSAHDPHVAPDVNATRQCASTSVEDLTGAPHNPTLAAWKAKRQVLFGQAAEEEESGRHQHLLPPSPLPELLPSSSAVAPFQEEYWSPTNSQRWIAMQPSPAATTSKQPTTRSEALVVTLKPSVEGGHVATTGTAVDREAEWVASGSHPSSEQVLVQTLKDKVNKLDLEIQHYSVECKKLSEAQEALARQQRAATEATRLFEKERSEFEIFKHAELTKLESWKQDQKLKIDRDRKVAARQARVSGAGAMDRKDRQEVDALRAEITKLKADVAASDLRYKAAMERHRSIMEKKEAENAELNRQLKLYEDQRLEATFFKKKQEAAHAGVHRMRASEEVKVPREDATIEAGLGVERPGANASAPPPTTATAYQSANVIESLRATNPTHPGAISHQVLAVRPPSSNEATADMSPEFRLHLNRKWHLATFSAGTTMPTISEVALEGGKKELQCSDGTRIVVFRNGTQKEYCIDGSIIIRYNNGDVKREFSVDGHAAEAYLFSDSGVIHTTLGPELQAYHFPSGQVEMHWANSRVEIMFPNGKFATRTAS
jgi:hypothetical protein